MKFDWRVLDDGITWGGFVGGQGETKRPFIVEAASYIGISQEGSSRCVGAFGGVLVHERGLVVPSEPLI